MNHVYILLRVFQQGIFKYTCTEIHDKHSCVKLALKVTTKFIANIHFQLLETFFYSHEIFKQNTCIMTKNIHKTSSKAKLVAMFIRQAVIKMH